jgi:hypothetical protein
MSSRYEELERLQRLRGSGALTEEEFQVEKRRLLGHGEERSMAEAEPEAADGERRARRIALLILGLFAIAIAIALGLWLGRDVRGGDSGPEANVALPQDNAAMADDNLVAPPPPPDVRTLPPPEQMARAFAAAFGASGAAQLRVGGHTIVYHPARLMWVDDKAVLISPASASGDCADCAGTVAVHYLTPAGDHFQVAGSWPQAVSGAWNGAVRWRLTSAFTTRPAIWEEGVGGGGDCTLGTATITELTADGPVQSGPIPISYRSKGGLKSLLMGETNLTSRAGNIAKDVSFDVVYSGTDAFTETWTRQGDRFVLQGGQTKVPQC